MQTVVLLVQQRELELWCLTPLSTTFQLHRGGQHRNRICGVLVSVAILNAVDRGFEPQLDQIKDYNIGMYYFLVE